VLCRNHGRNKKEGVITFSPHELPACVILPPRTTTSTKKEHQTTISIYFGPFRQSNSCKNLNVLTQFKKWPKYPHLKKKKTEGKESGSSHPHRRLAATPEVVGGCHHLFSFSCFFFFKKKIIIIFLINYCRGHFGLKIKINGKKWHITSKLTGFPDGIGQSM